MAEIPRTCPHCRTRLSRWLVPEEGGWEEPFFLVCFNDDCPYYRDGWSWMKEQYNQRVSYRYTINPTTGAASPLPVWSPAALREMIADDPEGGDE